MPYFIFTACDVMSQKPPEPDEAEAKAARLATAYHESGHAVMALLQGRPIEKVTICPAEMTAGGSRLGACKIQKGQQKSIQDPLEAEVLILLAGMVGESHITERYCHAGASQDLMMVERLLSRRTHKERELRRLAKRMLSKTEHILNREDHRKAIASIAVQLVEKETISGRAVRQLFAEAVQQK